MKSKLVLVAIIATTLATNVSGQNWLLLGNGGTDSTLNFIGTTNAKPLTFKTNGTARMIVSSNGYVGVGTSAPVYNFDMTLGSNAYFNVRSNSANATVYIDRKDTSKVATVNYRTNGASKWAVGMISDGNYSLKNSTSSSVAFTVKATNNYVGIGILSPTQRLHVSGNIKASNNLLSAGLLVGPTGKTAAGYIACIEGKLIAEEVRVDLHGVWPDYVFGNEYKLMTLDELESNIETFKHLPGIPSAAEIKSNGILLGDMQARLIEKMEESTLYIIQLHNENKELKMKMDAMQKQIDELGGVRK